MRVRLLRNTFIDGQAHPAGAELDVDDDIVITLLSGRKAEVLDSEGRLHRFSTISWSTGAAPVSVNLERVQT